MARYQGSAPAPRGQQRRARWRRWGYRAAALACLAPPAGFVFFSWVQKFGLEKALLTATALVALLCFIMLGGYFFVKSTED